MNSKQTRISSLMEANINTIVGFVLSVLCWKYVVVLIWADFEDRTDWGTSAGITVLFTVLSIGRNYAIRRYFNRKI